MQILETKEKNIFRVFFTDHESLLVSTLIGSSYSGADQWRVPLEDYEAKFDITHDHAEQLSDLIIDTYYEKKSQVPISLSRKELQAIRKMIEHMMNKWDEGDFSTLAGTEKSEAVLLADQFKKAGF